MEGNGKLVSWARRKKAVKLIESQESILRAYNTEHIGAINQRSSCSHSSWSAELLTLSEGRFRIVPAICYPYRDPVRKSWSWHDVADEKVADPSG